MKRFIIKTQAMFILMVIISSVPEKSLSAVYDIFGVIESKRKDNLVTVLFDSRPLEKSYLIIHDERELGKVTVLAVSGGSGRGKCSVTARYILFNENSENLIRAGVTVGLKSNMEKVRKDSSKHEFYEQIDYWETVVSEVDEREMILVPSGKFLLGSNGGDRDEYPEQEIFVKAFYMDKFEVSNQDYKKFVDATKSQPPRSWEKGRFDDAAGDLPVLVTYYEADKYARWAGKRLPTEIEWEKAARGSDDLDNLDAKSAKRAEYPWGMKFSPEKGNFREYWQEGEKGRDAKDKKERMAARQEGLLSVYSFQDRGGSPYGIINMAGNASEWTSSWYMPYKNNRYENRKYGKQYKVIRGGSWYSDRFKVRVTNREIGGIPSLDRDNFAGFRCIKDITSLDRVIKKP